jgi:hypothetical protein
MCLCAVRPHPYTHGRSGKRETIGLGSIALDLARMHSILPSGQEKGVEFWVVCLEGAKKEARRLFFLV